MRILLLVLSILLLFSAGCGEEGTTDNASWKRGPGVEAFLQGAEYVKKGQHQKALENFNEAIRLDPKMLPAYHGRSIIRREMGDLDGAIKDYNKVISLDPDNVRTYAVRGFDRLKTDDLNGVIEDYSKVISLDPNSVRNYAVRGFARMKAGDLDGAIDDFNNVIRLDPKNVRTYAVRGLARMETGDLDGAIDDFNNVISLDPKDVRAYIIRGDARSEKGDLAGAIDDFSKAISLDPNYATAYNGLAWLLATCSNPAFQDGNKAVKLALQAMELNNSRSYYEDTLAAAYARAGLFGKAIPMQVKALAMARKANDKGYIKEFKDRLDLYRQGKPFQEE